MLEDLGDKIRRNDEPDNSHLELLKEGVLADSNSSGIRSEHAKGVSQAASELIWNNRYRVMEKKQRNPYSGRTAYLAEDMQTGAQVYLKEFGMPRVKDADYVEIDKQFKAELSVSQMLSGLEGSVVPHVIETFEDGYLRYIVFEKKEGTSLRETVEEKKWYSERDVAGIALQALDQLKPLHEDGKINRDIKPDHLLVDREYRLTGFLDFSAANDREYSTNTLTRGIYSGFFSAPEAITGKKPDFRSDYYSLGAVMFYMLTKKVPEETLWIYKPSKRFLKKELKRAKVSSGLGDIVVKLLSENPDKRYQDYDSFRKDLVKVYGKERFESGKDTEQHLELMVEDNLESKISGIIRKPEHYNEDNWKMQYLTYGKKMKRTNFPRKLDALMTASTAGAAAILYHFLGKENPHFMDYLTGIFPILINGFWVLTRGYELTYQLKSSRHLPHNYAANKNRKDLADGLRKTYSVSPSRALRYAADCKSSAMIHEGVESTFMMYDDIQKVYLEILNKAIMCENQWDIADKALDGIAGLEGKASVNPKVMISRLLENFDHRELPSGLLNKARSIGKAKDDWVPVEFAKKVHAITHKEDVIGG